MDSKFSAILLQHHQVKKIVEIVAFFLEFFAFLGLLEFLQAGT